MWSSHVRGCRAGAPAEVPESRHRDVQRGLAAAARDEVPREAGAHLFSFPGLRVACSQIHVWVQVDTNSFLT